MIAQLCILFALVGVVYSSGSLREEPTAIPVDHERVNSVVRNLIKSSHTQLKSDVSFLKKHTEALTVKGKKEMEAAAGKNTMSHEHQGQKKIIKDGYYVTRHRRNADCSGVPSLVTGSRVSSSCQNFGSGYGSSITGCTHENADGKVVEAYYSFASDDCTGEPNYVSEFKSNDKCSYNVQDTDQPAEPVVMPEMRAVQCTSNGMNALKDGGFITLMFDSTQSTCDGPPLFFSMQKIGDCQLNVEYDNEEMMVNENTRYSYISVSQCTDNGVITMTGYSDPACKRPLYQGTSNLGRDMPNFNTCAMDPYGSGMYMTAACRQPGYYN